MCRIIVITFCLLLQNVRCDNLYLAGIFEGSEIQEEAFNFAISKINENATLKLEPLIDDSVEADDARSAINAVCNLAVKGVVGVFGPSLRSDTNVDAVQATCDEKEIPFMLTRWMNPIRSGITINFYPHPTFLSRAYIDIIDAMQWKTFTLLYDDEESLVRMAELIANAKDKEIVVAVEQLDSSGDYRPVLKNVWRTTQKFLVVDCRTENLREVLLQCQQVGLMTHEHNYFLTNLDAHTTDLSPFMYSDTNITGIRIVNPENETVQEISYKLFKEEVNQLEAAWKLQTESALILDAIEMYSMVLTKMETHSPLEVKPLDCESANSWTRGLSAVNLLKTITHEGLTGHIEFNTEGYRSNFDLQVYEVKEGGVIQTGSWNSQSEKLELFTRAYDNVSLDDASSLKNKSFTVIITLTDPYGMLKENKESLSGNERFEGFSIDLISALSEMEGFNYTFILREDGKNGERISENEWSGMIGDVMSGRADLAITDLTITAERAAAVDFTEPFMNLGITILFKKPETAAPSFFSFAEPFALETWVAMAIAFVVVSLSYFVLGRLCPREWDNPYPCIDEPEYLINQFGLNNCFWFVTGAMLQQGSEMAPVAIPTRMISGIWWFFILIIVASYTANLSSFLITENKVEVFSDVEGLAKRAEEGKVTFGAKKGGATASFFNASSNELYQKIGKYMTEHQDKVMMSENKDGVNKAEEEAYAFFMESTSIDYITQRHCSLTRVGENLDNKGYGIAMKKKSPYRTTLSKAILKLQASGAIDDIRKKWWEERRGGGLCTGTEKDEGEAQPLDVENLEGVFYVTLVGSIAAAFLVIFEFLANVFRISRKTKVPFKQVLIEELKFGFNFGSNVKPIIRHSSSMSRSKTGSISRDSRRLSMIPSRRTSIRSRSMRRQSIRSGSLKSTTRHNHRLERQMSLTNSQPSRTESANLRHMESDDRRHPYGFRVNRSVGGTQPEIVRDNMGHSEF